MKHSKLGLFFFGSRCGRTRSSTRSSLARRVYTNKSLLISPLTSTQVPGSSEWPITNIGLFLLPSSFLTQVPGSSEWAIADAERTEKV